MKIVNQHTTLLYLILPLISVAAVILFVRTRSGAAIVMCAGMAVYWLGFALLFLGPKKEIRYTSPMDNRESGVHRRSITVRKTPTLPVGFIMSAGLIIFAGGFLYYVARA
jgi:hypothetical protein